jgi:hypothetical protein
MEKPKLLIQGLTPMPMVIVSDHLLLFLPVLCFICSVAIAGQPHSPSPARFTAKVVDDDGNPVMGAIISGGFYGVEPRQQGVTDSNGLFVLECKKADFCDAGFTANKDGYYQSGVPCYFTNVIDGRWLPWDPVVTAVLRRIINPIPMYAKKVTTKIPMTNECCGYDLMVGDWVRPAGRGVVSDFVFRVDGSWKDDRNYHYVFSLSFSHGEDGAIPFAYPTINRVDDTPVGSKLLVPNQAPENGYISSNTWHYSQTQTPDLYGHDAKTNDCHKPIVFRFRIRSSTNEAGVITNACYGKLRSISFWPRRLAGSGGEVSLNFTYYLNPTPNDRNLEFDPKRNLMTNFGKDEQGIQEP